MKIWIDDLRPMPEEFDFHCRSVYDAIRFLTICESIDCKIDVISLDHDAGAEVVHGGDFIQVLKYLEWLKRVAGTELCTKFRIHTGNPIGAEYMRQIIKRCGWEEFTFDWEEMF